jgi:hypothetical protein
MKSFLVNRHSNKFLTLASVAAIIVVTAVSIELLYQVFHFIETTLAASARQANQYVSYGY